MRGAATSLDSPGSLAERLDRFLLEAPPALQDLERHSPQRAGSRALWFDAPPISRSAHSGRSACEDFPQILRIDRLDQMRIETKVQRSRSVLGLTITCQGDDLDCGTRIRRPNPLCHFIAVHAGQSDVEEYGLRAK